MRVCVQGKLVFVELFEILGNLKNINVMCHVVLFLFLIFFQPLKNVGVIRSLQAVKKVDGGQDWLVGPSLVSVSGNLGLSAV